MRTIVWLASLLLAASAALAAEKSSPRGWVDERGNPAPDTPARKSLKGFGGMLLVTDDQDWREKWERPENPSYSTTDKVAIGETLWTLIVFTNPGVRADGTVNVRCDIKITRGDGTISADEKDLPCFEGELGNDPHNLQLAHVTPGFQAEASDPAGHWTLEVHITDAVKHVTLDLETGFDFHKP